MLRYVTLVEKVRNSTSHKLNLIHGQLTNSVVGKKANSYNWSETINILVYSQQSLFTSCSGFTLGSWQGLPKCTIKHVTRNQLTKLGQKKAAIHGSFGGAFESRLTLSIHYDIFNLQASKEETPKIEHSICPCDRRPFWKQFWPCISCPFQNKECWIFQKTQSQTQSNILWVLISWVFSLMPLFYSMFTLTLVWPQGVVSLSTEHRHLDKNRRPVLK